MNTFAWIGFGLMVALNVYNFIASTIKVAQSEYPTAAVIVYWTLSVWFVWSCFHLLRVA